MASTNSRNDNDGVTKRLREAVSTPHVNGGVAASNVEDTMNDDAEKRSKRQKTHEHDKKQQQQQRRKRRRWDDDNNNNNNDDDDGNGNTNGIAAAREEGIAGRATSDTHVNTVRNGGHVTPSRTPTTTSTIAGGGGGGGGGGGVSAALAKARAALQKQAELKEKLRLVKELKNKDAKTKEKLEKASVAAREEEEKRRLTKEKKEKLATILDSGGANAKSKDDNDNDNDDDGDDDDNDDDPYYDERMGRRGVRSRAPRSFEFYEPGALVKEAEKERQRIKMNTEGPREADRFAALLSGPLGGVYGSRGGDEDVSVSHEIPDVEWWDVPLLLRRVQAGSASASTSSSYDVLDLKNGGVMREKMSIYVEHPIPIEPPAEAPPPPPQPLMLTQKERKKLRTQRRMALEKEKQEMIRQGLLEPPKPKVKMSNMMRVLGDSATADPTAVEAAVRAEAKERQQAHEDRNLANKLTPAERRAKKNAKLHGDAPSGEVSVSLYRLAHIRSGKQRFKIDINASENRLSGRIVKTPHFVVVVVEGGAKGMRRFHKLMTHRIKWDEDEGDGDGGGGGGGSSGGAGDEGDPGSGSRDAAAAAGPNSCSFIWSGVVKEAAFSGFKFESCSSEFWATKFFKDAGVQHYFDMAKTST